jgi:hypothetical protein
MNSIKFYFNKINIFFKIYKNYSSLSKSKHYLKINSNTFFRVLYHIILDKLIFIFFFHLNSKWVLSLIEKETLFFSIRSANVLEKFFISNNSRKYNSLKKNLSSQLSKIKNNGYLNLGKIFSKTDCIKFINYLENKKYYNSQSPLQSDGKLRTFKKKNNHIKKFAYSAFPPNEFMGFKKLQNFLNSKKLLDLIDSYLNFKSDIYSAVTWVNVPSKKKHYVTNMHRDYDDFKFLVLIINWTNVTKNNGATRFVKQSHIYDLSEEKKNKNTFFLEGECGSVYLADTFALHSGTPLKEGVRVSSWIRFGKLINSATIQDGFVTTP